MRNRPHSALFLVFFCAIFLSQCGGSGTQSSADVPTPILTSISPSSTPLLGPGFTLELNGSGFIPTSQAMVGPLGLQSTTFVNEGQLTTFIPAAMVAVLGDVSVQVLTLVPQGACNGHFCGFKNSNGLTFTVMPTAARTIVRANLSNDGSQALGGDSEQSSVSISGRFVAFDSAAANLVPNDTNSSLDVFLRDTCVGTGGSCTPSTTRVSVASDGSEGNGDSTNPSTNVVTTFTSTNPLDTPDGRFIAFQSVASNLVAGDTNGKVDVFVHDTCRAVAGSCTPSTIRVSVLSDGSEGNGDSINPAINSNGRYVAFQSSASNFYANDTNGTFDVFVRDTCVDAVSGCTPSTTAVSVAIAGGLGNGSSTNPSISASGRFIAFQSTATNLVPDDTNGSTDIFVRDTCVGAPPGCTPSTTRVSVASNGTQSDKDSSEPSISGDGGFIAFASLADNLVPNDTNNGWDVFVHDMCLTNLPGCMRSTTRVSVASDGSGSEGDASDVGIRPSISAGGRYIAFATNAANLVPNDTNSSSDVFIRDTCRGSIFVPSNCQPSTTRVSVATDGSQANAGSILPSISPDGGFIVFRSVSTNLMTNDSNGLADIYLSLY